MAARTHLWPGFTARAVLPVVLVPVLATVLTVPQRASAVLTCPTVAGDGTVSPTIRSGDDVTGCDLTDANLVGSNLTGVDFTNANLTTANLSTANLTDSTLTGANLNYANIENAVLWGVRSGGISAESLAFSYPWNFDNGFLLGPGANLANTDLTMVDLRWQQLAGANLSGANMSGRDLTFINLTNANVRSANLNDTDMISVNGAHADFTNATFRGAHFLSSVFATAQCSGADFSDATFGGGGMSLNPDGLSGANFTGAAFTGVRVGPFAYSSIGSGLEVTYFSDSSATSVNMESLIPGQPVTEVNCSLVDEDGRCTSTPPLGDSLPNVQLITFPESLTSLGDLVLDHSPANTLTFLGDVPAFVPNLGSYWGTFFGMDPPEPGVVTVQYRPTHQGSWDEDGSDLILQLPSGSRMTPIYQVAFSSSGSGVSGSPDSSAILQTLWNQPITVSDQGTLSRPGYTFAGWATSFDGTPVGSTYMPTADTTLYSTWTRNSSGGDTPAPAPTPSTSASSTPTPTSAPTQEPETTPTPTPSVNAIGLPNAAALQATGPQSPGKTKALAKGVPAGTSKVLVNGRLEPSRLDVWERGMTVRSGPVVLAVRGVKASGSGIAPSDGSLVLPDAGSRSRAKVPRSPRIALGGDGNAASTPMRVFLIPQPSKTASKAANERIHDLGYVMTGADGALRGSVAARVRKAGSYILQINGKDERGAIRSVNLPAIVK